MPVAKIYGDYEGKTRLSAHVPANMYAQLAQRAKRNHRTITREVIAIVDQELQREEAALSQERVLAQ